MKAILLAVFALSALELSLGLDWKKLRGKFGKFQCEPLNGAEPQPCYDFSKKKIVQPKNCGMKRHFHCCIYNCKCILKGAGNPEAIIPDEHAMESSLPTKKQAVGENLLDGCVPVVSTSPETTTLEETASPKPTTRKPVKRKPSTKKTPVKKPPTKKTPAKSPVTKTTTMKKPTLKPKSRKPARLPTTRPPVKKPAVKKPPGKKPSVKQPAKQPSIKPTPKKPSKKPPPKKPKRKPPTKKPLKKPSTKKPTKKPTKPTKKPCPTTTTKKPSSFSFGFFSRFSQLLGGFGFQAKTVSKDCE